MVSIFDSPELGKAQSLFSLNPDYNNSPLLQFINQQGKQASNVAMNQQNASNRNMGLGNSTFGQMLSGGAGYRASQPYVGQMAQTGEQQRQFNSNSILNLLSQEQSRRQYDDELRAKQQQSWMNAIMGGVGLINPIAGGIGKYLTDMNTQNIANTGRF